MRKWFFNGRKFYRAEGNQIWVCDYEKVTGRFGEGMFKKPGSDELIGTFQTDQEAEEELERMKREFEGR